MASQFASESEHFQLAGNNEQPCESSRDPVRRACILFIYDGCSRDPGSFSQAVVFFIRAQPALIIPSIDPVA